MLEKEKIVVEALELQKEYEEAKKFNKLLSYEPYRYQAEFHRSRDDSGNQARQRCLMAGNKVGKTFCGAAEMAYHLTGL